MRTVNLLPRDRVQALARELWRRVFLFYAKVVFVVLGLLAAELVLLELTFRIERLSLKPDAALEARLKEFERVTAAARQTNQLLATAEALWFATPAAHTVVDEILEAFPEGITLTKLHFDRRAGTLDLAGQAVSRSLLLALEARLKERPHVEAVAIPAASFTKSRQADFVITLTLKL